MSVQGRDFLTGKPKQVSISFREIAKALDKSILRVEDAVMETLSQTPPELAADIYNTGIYWPVADQCFEDWIEDYPKRQIFLFILQKTH